jgi:hypothetical protein
VTIKVGDLVMVWRPGSCQHCEPTDMGRVFRVHTLVPAGLGSCAVCFGLFDHKGGARDIDNLGYELIRLKRLDPLSEPEHITEEATA